jgi:hypothetical protein
MRTRSLILISAAMLGLAACRSESARDAEEGAVASAEVDLLTARQSLLENDWAEAFTITLEPGQRLAPHAGLARVVYALSNYQLRYTAGTDTTESSWQSGDVHAHDAGEHAIENIGTTQARLLFVARRSAALVGGAAAAAPSAPATPEAGGPMTLRLDDDDFRVSEVVLPAGATLPRHPGMPRVVYALSDYTIRYEADGAAPRDGTFRAGEAHWHEADRHVITNTGATEARFLIVQFKR